MDTIKFGQALVRALLRDQHPDLADLELRDVNGGWDNQQWRLGDEPAVRAPAAATRIGAVDVAADSRGRVMRRAALPPQR